MQNDSQGIIRDTQGQEQPADKDRARKATKTEPGHMPSQKVIKKEDEKDELQLLKEKSGF
jgi:hypothetical protein